MNVRPATSNDFDAVIRLLREDEEHLLGRPSRVGPADLQQWLTGTDLERDTWIVDDYAAFGWANTFVGDVGFAVGVVHPRAKGRGIGAQLVDRSEGRLRERGVERVHQIALAADPAAPELFASRGYREVRRFYEMAIELDGPPPAPVLPAGLTIEPFDERDAEQFYLALDEAFQDHWEHVTRGFDVWWNEKRNAPGYDPTLWFVVRDGDELAATMRNDPKRNDGGYIAALGVRRAWRGRGLGRALLLHAFAEFQRRGETRVTLGVDTANPTGATQLYESVGMHAELEHVVYERRIA